MPLTVPSGSGDMLGANNLTDVAVAATAFTNIKQAASDTATGAIELAIQSEMETATDVGRAVVPGRQHFHPGHPKAFGNVNQNSGTPALVGANYGVTSITDTAVGRVTVNLSITLSAATYTVIVNYQESLYGIVNAQGRGKTTTTFEMETRNDSGTLVDPANTATGTVAFILCGDI